MFGPFSVNGEVAFCRDGDYHIYANGAAVNIRQLVPSCVSK